MYASNRFRLRAERVVRDALGVVVWRIVEVDTSGIPGAPGGRCLLLDGAPGVRRVWNYPGGWERLPAAELVALISAP